MDMFTQGGNIREDMKLKCLLKNWMVEKLTAFIPTLKPLGFLPFYCKKRINHPPEYKHSHRQRQLSWKV